LGGREKSVSAGKAAADAPPVTILLVDDTPGKLLTYEAVLEGLGQNLIKVQSVKDALSVLLKTDVALIVTDVRMPGEDGFQLAKLVRDHPRFARIPIMFVTAEPSEHVDHMRALASGAVDYVSVPVAAELLRAKVKVFIDLFAKERELAKLKDELEARVASRTNSLAESEERYRALVDGANDIVATLDLEGRFTSVNPAVDVILGYSAGELLGTPLKHYIPLEQLPMHEAMLKRKLEGERATTYEMQIFGKDRQQLFTLEVNSRLIVDEAGGPTGIHSIARDVTERKQAEQRQAVLIRELQHRTKNLLAVIQSIVTNTLQRDPAAAKTKDVLIGRLHALSRAQEFVAAGPTAGVPLRDLVRAELSGFCSRVSLDGIPVVLGGTFAQQFALVLHELATNAAKYGSLSTPHGRVLINWRVDGTAEPTLLFSWRECDGPPVQLPTEQGFGTRLIAAALPGEHNISFKVDGLEFAVEVPLSEVVR
jgi:PAS domain S-box-containing protein